MIKPVAPVPESAMTGTALESVQRPARGPINVAAAQVTGITGAEMLVPESAPAPAAAPNPLIGVPYPELKPGQAAPDFSCHDFRDTGNALEKVYPITDWRAWERRADSERGWL